MAARARLASAPILVGKEGREALSVAVPLLLQTLSPTEAANARQLVYQSAGGQWLARRTEVLHERAAFE
jgi:hypothetical protein